MSDILVLKVVNERSKILYGLNNENGISRHNINGYKLAHFSKSILST